MTWNFQESSSYKEIVFPAPTLLDKNELRRWMRQKRAQQDPRIARLRNRRIADRISSLPEIASTRCIALYASMKDEVLTDAIASFLLESGKTVVYPRVVQKELHFFSVRDLEKDLCRTGSFGIREPDPERCEPIPIESIDLFMIPGIAFDPFGGRVGFGGGYYDRLLVNRRADALIVALAFEFQVVHAIRTCDTDQTVDRIITEESIYCPKISTYLCPNEGSTRTWAKSLFNNGLGQDHILAIHANLGVGKTVFAQGLANALHAESDVISPTFIYCREYEGTIPLIHVDAYRLDGISEGDEPFWDEILDRKGLRVIEWAERLGNRLPKSAIHCFGKIHPDNTREWTLFTPLCEQTSLHFE